MQYKSTRSDSSIPSAKAILNGIAHDGGLYVPTKIPKLDVNTVISMSYQEIAFEVLSLFFDDLDALDLKEAILSAYNQDNFTHPKITGLRKLDDNTDILELFYGKTSAFKDQALSLYPYLLKLAMKKEAIKKLTILTATSGDTGKAAMEAISNIDGLSIAVLFPKDGTSRIQKLQMQTQVGDNVLPLGVDGNFDDAQMLIKDFFLKHDALPITSANSINIARLLPQIIYYYDLYVRLDSDEAIDIYVPTGNFGNILAAYIAKEMGLPIRKLIVCTNENNVLYEFFKTGIYDIRDKAFKVTHAPSMDILVSSNLERLLYFKFHDEKKLDQWMRNLKDKGYFKLDAHELAVLQEDFDAQMSDDEKTKETIKDTFMLHDILIDPHTACAIPQDTNTTKRVVVSTASPYKFPKVYGEIFELDNLDDFYVLSEMSLRSHEPYPTPIRLLPKLKIRFNKDLQLKDVEETLLQFIETGEIHEV